MKKIGLVLGVLAVLLTVSCSDILVSGGDGGSISLVIDGSTAQSIRSAGAMRDAAGGSTYTLTASIRGDYTATQSVSSSAEDLGSVTFTFERVPAGRSIILDLTATATNGSYIWYGSSGRHTVTRGENQLRIAVGRVSGVLLWSTDSSSQTSNMAKIAPYGNYSDPADLTYTMDGSPGSLVFGDIKAYCFDKQGNLYGQNEDNVVYKFPIGADGMYADGSKISAVGDSFFNYLSYDNISGRLYGIGNDVPLLYYDVAQSSFVSVSNGDSVNGGSYWGLAVHDNVVYTIESGGETSDGVQYATLRSYSISFGESRQATSSLKLEKTDSFLMPSFCTGSQTGQMIYQEGALYLLVGRVDVPNTVPSETDYERFSCGALLKINPTTLTLETSFGNSGCLGLASGRTISGTYDSRPYSMTLYSPAGSNEGASFYGPVGFVAVMPKKLAIGDAGYALSKNASDGLGARRKTRVVTVDLETQAFDVASLGDVSSYGNTITSCGFLVVEQP